MRQLFSILAVSLLAGTTVYGNANGTSRSSSTTLIQPWGITTVANDSILIADPGNDRVTLTRADSRTPTSIIGIAQLSAPSKAMYDANMTNLYVLNAASGSLMRFTNGSATGTTIFGSSGSSLNQLIFPHSFAIDSRLNFYIADTYNHRILLWWLGASNGIVIAGSTGAPGNGSFRLDTPTDIILDKTDSYVYVSDHGNHRVLRFKLSSTNGTVIAGGNGPRTGRKQVFGQLSNSVCYHNVFFLRCNQLNEPLGICLSKKNNALYVADQLNSRIQRWYLGDSQGVTIAGSPNGTLGTTPFTLSQPNNLALNDNATCLFVTDRDNNRVQMFTLI